MSLRISSIAGAGDFDKERLIMRAGTDLDIGGFSLFCCKVVSENQVDSGDVACAYWFEDYEVKSGDLVILYTKSGKRSSKVNESGSTSHFIYWERRSPIWSPEYRAVLIQAKVAQFGPLLRPSE